MWGSVGRDEFRWEVGTGSHGNLWGVIQTLVQGEMT